MSCSRVAAAVLGEYWMGLLPASDADAVEEHLFECDDCGQRLREVIALADSVRRLAREGRLRMVVSDAFVERVAADGTRIRQYDVSPGGAVQCTVAADDDLLLARLATDLRGAGRVDVSLCDADGVERLRLPDVPHRPDASDVLYQESIVHARALPTSAMIVRLVAVDEGGRERVLGEYTFNHTRSLPGPGGHPAA
jgi:anti-sigma factor RsiW